MTTDRIFEDYLEDILQYAGKAIRFLEETPALDDLKEDERTLLAVVRALEVVGEAVKRIPKDFRDRYARIPWRGMTGMRDKVIHEYFWWMQPWYGEQSRKISRFSVKPSARHYQTSTWIESEKDVEDCKTFLRTIGYKL